MDDLPESELTENEQTPDEAKASKKKLSAYEKVISAIFSRLYAANPTHDRLDFEREEVVSEAQRVGPNSVKNPGDLIYTYRFRRKLPDAVTRTQPTGKEWRIKLAGIARYAFLLRPPSLVIPDPTLEPVRIPDATPQIITAYALSDEQAALAVIRYNALIGTFLGITAYSLQAHLRTTVTDVGQVEVDEIYVGVDGKGQRYVIPVQAKGGSDKISIAQTEQDTLMCAEKFPDMIVAPVSVQIMGNGRLAMFHLEIAEDETLRVVAECHYIRTMERPRSSLSKKSREALMPEPMRPFAPAEINAERPKRARRKSQ